MVSNAYKHYKDKRRKTNLTKMSESKTLSKYSTKQLKLRWLKKADYDQPNSIIDYDILNPPELYD